MEGVGDILCSLDARDATGTTEAPVWLENQRESPELVDRVAGLIHGGRDLEIRGVLANPLPVATHRSFAGGIRGGFFRDGRQAQAC